MLAEALAVALAEAQAEALAREQTKASAEELNGVSRAVCPHLSRFGIAWWPEHFYV